MRFTQRAAAVLALLSSLTAPAVASAQCAPYTRNGASGYAKCGSPIGPTFVPWASTPPEPVGGPAAVGVGTTAARADHVHALAGATMQFTGAITTTGANVTRYMTFTGASATASSAIGMIAQAKTLRNLSCLDSITGGTGTATVQYFDGVTWADSGITVALSAGSNVLSDTTHTQATSATYGVGIKYVTSAGYTTNGAIAICTVEVWP